MTTMTHQGLSGEEVRALLNDPRKLAEDNKQLAGEAESRSRRIQNRKAHQLKLEQTRRDKRRKRAFKLAGVWGLAIIAGFIGIAWFAPEILHRLG